MSKREQLSIAYSRFENISDLPEVLQNLYKSAQDATHTAYAPYSNFLVGAAILLEDGEVIKGSNQENAAYPSGLCAERTAVYYLGSCTSKKIKAVAVAARRAGEESYKAVTPCGSCRQALSEYENKQDELIKFLLPSENGVFILTDSIASLLPFEFSSKNLL